jgi:small multidrug resistance pump
MSGLIILGAAIIAEVCGTVALRFSDGFTKLVPSGIVVVGYGLSFYLLSLALKKLDLSLAYAIWSGVGTALVAIIGMVALGEPMNAIKAGCIVLIIAGVVGLNFAGAH